MNHQALENLDELIAEEKRLLAEEYLLETWEAASEDGIEAGIIARAFATCLLKKLSRESGDAAVSNLLGDLKTMDDSGDFIPGKTVQ